MHSSGSMPGTVSVFAHFTWWSLRPYNSTPLPVQKAFFDHLFRLRSQFVVPVCMVSSFPPAIHAVIAGDELLGQVTPL